MDMRNQLLNSTTFYKRCDKLYKSIAPALLNVAGETEAFRQANLRDWFPTGIKSETSVTSESRNPKKELIS